MHAHGSKSGVKNETPKLPETRESLGKTVIFLLLKSDFLHTKFDFLHWLSPFFNGFLLSSTAFRFLHQLSAFFNSFPISSMVFQFFSMAFRFPRNPRKSILRRRVYERSLFELHISRHSLPKLCNFR